MDQAMEQSRPILGFNGYGHGKYFQYSIPPLERPHQGIDDGV